MVYEIRVYEAHDGRLEALRSRFLAEVAPRLPRHGIELVGVFDAAEPDGKLTYITRFPDEEARAAGWASFSADPEWKAIKAASEVDGPLLARQSLSILKPAQAGLRLA
jgi:hypothetical protein